MTMGLRCMTGAPTAVPRNIAPEGRALSALWPRARTWMLRVANSTPIVDLDSRQNSFLVNRLSRFDLPTPESPISTTLNR